MKRLARVALLGSTLLLVAACAKKEEPKTDTAAAIAPAPAPAPTVALADVAGKWKFASVPIAAKDSSPTPWVLTATADTTGWSMEFPDKQVVPLRVSVSGDSIGLVSGEFRSQRRKNTKVTTETTLHLVNGKLVGVTTAHYPKGADSVAQLRSEGTRMP